MSKASAHKVVSPLFASLPGSSASAARASSPGGSAAPTEHRALPPERTREPCCRAFSENRFRVAKSPLHYWLTPPGLDVDSDKPRSSEFARTLQAHRRASMERSSTVITSNGTFSVGLIAVFVIWYFASVATASAVLAPRLEVNAVIGMVLYFVLAWAASDVLLLALTLWLYLSRDCCGPSEIDTDLESSAKRGVDPRWAEQYRHCRKRPCVRVCCWVTPTKYEVMAQFVYVASTLHVFGTVLSAMVLLAQLAVSLLLALVERLTGLHSALVLGLWGNLCPLLKRPPSAPTPEGQVVQVQEPWKAGRTRQPSIASPTHRRTTIAVVPAALHEH